MHQLKVCSKCKESKALSEFYKKKDNKDGLRTECKVCSKEDTKKWRESNLEYHKEKCKNWKKANPERAKEHHKSAKAKNKAKNREINNTRPESYFRDREGRFKYCLKCDQYKSLTRFVVSKCNFDGFDSKCMDCGNQYFKHKYKTDPEFKAKRILRDELRRLFKLSGLKREKRSIELLGMSWTEVYNRLLKTLPEGYSEQDWLDGKLHVDHKIPVSWYERLYGTLTEDLIKRINHISNLQLLPVSDNLSKNNRYGHGINNEIILYEDWVITEQLSTISH